MQTQQESFWLQTRTILALALSILTLAEIVDLTIVSVALPNIMGALGANLNEISLTITSYIVATAIFIPLTGMVTAKYGVKKVVLVSAFLFGVSSVLCGLASTVGEMVIFRVIQGIGGAFLPSMTQAFIVNEFEGEDRSKVMTIFSSCVVLGPIIGPALGGAIAEHASWRWVFYVNVPICLIGFLVALFLMKDPKDDLESSKVKTDYISFIYMAIGIGCLEYFIDEGNQKNWFDSHELIIVLTTAIIFVAFFIWRGLREGGGTVVNFRVFKYRNYVLCCLAVWLFMITIIGALGFFPTLLQQGYGFPVDTAGYITAPRGIASFMAAPIFMYLSRKIDGRVLMLSGLGVFAISTYMLTTFSVVFNSKLILLTVMLQGVGMMGVFTQLMQLSYTNIPPQYNSDAAGIFNFFRNIGNSVGTSIASTIISRQQQVSWHDMASKLSLHKSSQYLTWSGHFPIKSAAPVVASMQVQSQAFVIANLDVFYLSFVGIFLIAWIPFLLDKPSKDATYTPSH